METDEKNNEEAEEVTAADTDTEEEVELNDGGVPRPPVDPRNGLYTFLSLLIFAVLYAGYHLISFNFFTPYTVTLTEFTEEQTAVLCEAVKTPLPDGAQLSYARLSRMTDNDNLYVRYSGIPDEDKFLESVGFEYYPADSEERIAVFRDETADVDYVYSQIFYCTEGGDLKLRLYEYESTKYAEFVFSDYGKPQRRVFKDGERRHVTERSPLPQMGGTADLQ